MKNRVCSETSRQIHHIELVHIIDCLAANIVDILVNFSWTILVLYRTKYKLFLRVN